MSYHREYFDEQPAAMYLIKLSTRGHIFVRALCHPQENLPAYILNTGERVS
jgi:hypothetical protein